MGVLIGLDVSPQPDGGLRYRTTMAWCYGKAWCRVEPGPLVTRLAEWSGVIDLAGRGLSVVGIAASRTSRGGHPRNVRCAPPRRADAARRLTATNRGDGSKSTASRPARYTTTASRRASLNCRRWPRSPNCRRRSHRDPARPGFLSSRLVKTDRKRSDTRLGNKVETRDLTAAVSRGLVSDLPDPVDLEQIVEVDPPTGLVGVKAELDRGSIPT